MDLFAPITAARLPVTESGHQEDLVNALSLPAYLPSEPLDAYLRRCMEAPGVNNSELARALKMNRSGLYQIKKGTLVATPPVLTRFGALAGVVEDTPAMRETLALFGLIESAEIGWQARASLSG